MKTTLRALILWCLLIGMDLNGQNCTPPYQTSCDPNANFCSPSSLSNITCQPFRFTGLDGYWSFVGDGSTITIRVTPNICFAGPPPGDGIAAQLLEDCSPVTVLPPPTHNLTDIVYTTEPCKVYTLYVLKVPGCSCDEIIISVMSSGGGGPPVIPRPVNLQINGDLCVCNEIEVCTNVNAPCNLLYQWEINGVPRPDLTDLECIDYQIPSEAPVTICVNVILGSEMNKCDEVKQCTTLTPRQLPPEREPLEIVCWEDHMDAGYQWYDKTIFTSCVNPPCTTQLQDRSGCCYEFIQPIILRKKPITTVRSAIVCDSTELPFISDDGQKWNESVCNEYITFKDPVYDCDTSYLLTLTVLDPSIIIDRICDRPDELVLFANVDLDIECPVGIVNYRLEWTNCNSGTVISTDTFLVVTSSGEYCLNMIIEFTNSDGSMGECIKSGGVFNIGPEDFGKTTVRIDGDLQICEGATGRYQAIPNSGITNYTWTIPSGNGTILTTEPETASEIEVLWDIVPGDSGVVCLSASEDCVSGDTCVVVEVIERPSPTVMNDSSVCGMTIALDGSSDGNQGNWSLVSPGNGAQFLNPDDINTSVTVDSFGEYIFVWSEGPQGCRGFDTVSVVFLESPEISILDTICDDEGKFYIVHLQVNGGTGGYSVVDGGGQVDSAGVYTSDTIDAGGTLSITIEDQFGCQVDYILKHDCDCGEIESGTLSPGLLSACRDECIEIVTNNDHILEPGQCVRMILHRDSIIDLSDPYSDLLDDQAFNSNGNQFCFDDQNMTSGQRYYVHYLVTQCDSLSGTPDLNFGCLKYSTVPIVFYDFPNPDVGPDTMVCGLEATLIANLPLDQTGQWQRISGPGNAMFGQNLAVSPLVVDEHGSHTFVWTQKNQECSATDTVVIRFLDAPVIDDWFVECDSLQENFRIVIRAIRGGDTASHFVSGEVVGGASWNATRNGQIWTSPWIVAGDSLNMIVNDQYGCLPDTLSLRQECECLTALGMLNVNPVMFCGPEGKVFANYSGGSRGPDDHEVYYLHEGSVNNIGNILNFNETGEFEFQAGAMQLNTPYFVTLRVGILNTDGTVNPEYSCMLETPGIEVIWYDTPVAMAEADQDTLYCNQDTVTLDGRSSLQRADIGQLDFEWRMGNQSHMDDQWEISSPGTYELIVTNAVTGCSDTSQITIGEAPGPEFAIFEVVHPNCDGFQSGAIRILDVEQGSAPFAYQIDGGNPSTNPNFNDLDPGSHSLTVVDDNGCQIDTTFEILNAIDIEVTAKEDQYIDEGESIDLDTLIAGLTGNLNGVNVYWINENGDSILLGQDETLLDSLYKSENPFSLVAINEDGCISIDHLVIYVNIETPTVYIPNVISPNGDGINDIFRVFVSSDKFDHIDQLQIYTRWGELIYQNQELIFFSGSGASEDGWDGTFRGEQMNPGVFVYAADLVDNLGNHHLFTGSLTVLE